MTTSGAAPFGLFGGAASGAASGATAGTVVPGVGNAAGAVIGAAIGAFSQVIGTDAKEQQREGYLNAQAAQAQNGNVGALKLIYDWANGISDNEWDGTNRGNEPNASKLYAQQILLNLQKNGIFYNPNAQQLAIPGVSALGATGLFSAVGGSPAAGFIELVVIGVALWMAIHALGKGR